MTSYQGRALRPESTRREGGGRLRRVLVMVGVLLVVAVLTQLPWGTMRKRMAVVHGVHVRGAVYLDADRVAAIAGIADGQDAIGLDLALARQRLLLHPRIGRAEVTRRWLRGVDIRIEERRPVLLVHHDTQWEMDSTGVLLEPLGGGPPADVPILTGLELARLRAGTQVSGPGVSRALAWVSALGDRGLQLAGQVSEVDVRDARSTRLVLMDGTCVVGPAWPLDVRGLSALRVVLADLHQRGVTAREVDLRYANQVIVRPLDAGGEQAGAPRRSQAG